MYHACEQSQALGKQENKALQYSHSASSKIMDEGNQFNLVKEVFGKRYYYLAVL